MQAPRRELLNREEHQQISKRGAQIARVYTGGRPHLADFREQEVTTILANSLNELHNGRWDRSVEQCRGGWQRASARLCLTLLIDLISLEHVPVAAGGSVAGQD